MEEDVAGVSEGGEVRGRWLFFVGGGGAGARGGAASRPLVAVGERGGGWSISAVVERGGGWTRSRWRLRGRGCGDFGLSSFEEEGGRRGPTCYILWRILRTLRHDTKGFCGASSRPCATELWDSVAHISVGAPQNYVTSFFLYSSIFIVIFLVIFKERRNTHILRKK